MTALMLGLATALLVVAVVGGVFVLYQIIRQQGRMLLRMDHLERLLVSQAAPSNVPVGPPVGSALEPFALADLAGRTIGLEDLAGRKALLVNWSPACGYCDLIGPDVATLGPQLSDAGTALVLVAHGDAASNRQLAEKHGITTPILLLGDSRHPAGFQTLCTPAAILVDQGGRLAGPVRL